MSTLQVSPGYASIKDEFEASLRRAFVDHHADYIVIYDRRQRFRWEAANYGQVRGWLSSKFLELDEQSAEIRYRLTAEGRTHFGIAERERKESSK